VKRKVKHLLRSGLMDVFRLSLRSKMIILPKHYYVPIADVNELARTRNRWAKRSKMAGIEMQLEEQIGFLRHSILPFQSEYLGGKTYLEGTQGGLGPGYGFIEAQAYHGVLRWLKPRRVIEIGSGVSTHCAIEAGKLNARETGELAEIVCIEPHPSAYIRASKEIRLISNGVEEVPTQFFESLGDGDLLFIDSSHAVRPAGDVIYLYCEVIPRLRPGVVIHIHDIYFPFTYQNDLLSSLFQWSETCLLQTLLVNNDRLKILFCMSMLHYEQPEELRKVFPEYVRGLGGEDGLHIDPGTHFPTSIYMRVV
jgi:methyltransferase family protein